MVQNGWSPLHVALMNNHISTVHFLVNKEKQLEQQEHVQWLEARSQSVSSNIQFSSWFQSKCVVFQIVGVVSALNK
jgi:ankyrin repeat protein